MDKSIFKEYIGTPFQELDEDGNYLGCLHPVYVVHPEAIRFKPTDNFKSPEFIQQIISQQYIPINEAGNLGDVTIIYQFGKYHFLVSVDHNTVVHSCPEIGFQYIKNAHKILAKCIVGMYRRKDLIGVN